MNEWEWQLLEEKTPVDHLEISGIEVRTGSRVRLRPRPGGDVMDIALAGQTATIECIEQDYEGKRHVCVVLDDDPGKDMGLLRQPGHRFFFDAEEVEPLSPDELPQMVAALESGKYGLAVGSRYVKGGGIRNWPLKRRITSIVACMLAWPLTPIRDITSGYLLVKREALQGVELDPIGFKIGLEVAAKAKYGKFLEVPYVFSDRVVGESKLGGAEIRNYLKQLGRLYAMRLFGARGHGIVATGAPPAATEKTA